MKKDRKIVDVEATETKEKVALNKEGKIVKATEVEAIPKEGAKPRRICAVILWILAIACEVVAILNIPPRSMMGIDSCGMLISAVHKENGEEKLHLLMVDDDIPEGAKLY